MADESDPGILGSITEIGYQAKAPRELRAYGFTDRNSYGNYIMWHEELERVPG
jgi:hypothetical protein